MTPSWKLRWRCFSLPRDGHAPDEYEDALAGNPKTGRFAIADGASESSFAGLWAKLLVEGFVASADRRTTMNWLTPLQQRWAREVDPLALDWFGEEKRQAGAFATFLGISLKKPVTGPEGGWKAMAVGDCCLFLVRGDHLLETFPVTRAAEFGNRPALLGSRSVLKNQVDPWSQAHQKIGRWQPGDRFFLMTDALAYWFLREHEARRSPWTGLLRRMGETDPTDALAGFVKQLRKTRELDNDDVTFGLIEF
jgi:hypothetical protein